MLQAVDWAQKVNGYVHEHYDLKAQIATTVGGQLFQLHFIMTYDSLAQMEQLTNQATGDAGYQELVAQAFDGGLILGTDGKSTIYRSSG